MSLSGSKSNTKSSSTMNQTNTNQLGADGLALLRQGADRLGNMQYRGVDADLISQFQNPYQQEVIDTTLADMNRAQQMSLQQGGDAAYAAGAFGGSRHGVADALSREAYDRNMAGTVANLRSQGYTNALSAAQNEAQNQNAWQALLTQLYGQYGSQLGQHGATQNVTGTQTGKSSGTSFGFEWAPKFPGMG